MDLATLLLLRRLDTRRLPAAIQHRLLRPVHAQHDIDRPVRGRQAVTAFTVAHSITLALATLGMVHVPAAPTEAIIALSILFLATEIVHKHNGQISLTERYPWVIAFVFGLFHGLGFAGALSEIGVPQHEVPLALFMFNVGVETGQLLFIAVVVSLMALLRRLPLTAPQGAWRVLPYSIGSVAAFWTIDRVMSFLPVAV